jgi:hypothetical protein
LCPPKNKHASPEGINDWAKKEGQLKKLTEISFPGGDFEVRIWMRQGVGTPVGTNGLVIKKEGQKWTGFNVDRMMSVKNDEMKNGFVIPKSEWETVWKKLTASGLLSLPDYTELENYQGDKVEDGVQFIVEINKDKVYRIYTYWNPDLDENNEARQMVRISDIIAGEFGLEEFRVRKDNE